MYLATTKDRSSNMHLPTYIANPSRRKKKKTVFTSPLTQPPCSCGLLQSSVSVDPSLAVKEPFQALWWLIGWCPSYKRKKRRVKGYIVVVVIVIVIIIIIKH